MRHQKYAYLQRWIRAKIVSVSADQTVVDVQAVDHPSVTINGLSFANEIYMLRTDLLFPALVCHHIINSFMAIEFFFSSISNITPTRM